MPISLFIILLTALAAAALAWYAWQRLKTREGLMFSLFALAAALWSLCVGLEVLSPSRDTMLFFSKLQYVGIAPLPVFWLLFALYYTGLERYLTPRRTALLFAIPILTIIFVWTNGWHNLIYREVALQGSGIQATLEVTHGSWFWLGHTVYSYGLLLLGVIVLVRGLVNASSFYRGQYLILLFAASFPITANLLFLAGVDLLGGVDPTPVSFALSCLVIAPGLLRYRLLDLMPVAHRTVFETLPVAILVLDQHSRIVDSNPAARHLLAQAGDPLIGRAASELVPGWNALLENSFKNRPARETHTDMRVTLGGTSRDLEVRVSALKNASRQAEGYVIMAQDVSDQKAYEKMAYHDPLTGLANRRLLELEADNALTLAQREGWTVALLYIDLDKFKPVNDRYGHDAGDLLLRQVAERLRTVSRGADVLTRFGGDEFVLLAQHIDEQEAEALATRIVSALKKPFKLADTTVYISGSIGIAFFPKDARHLDALISHADTAMYAAKVAGAGVRVYEENEPM